MYVPHVYSTHSPFSTRHLCPRQLPPTTAARAHAHVSPPPQDYMKADRMHIDLVGSSAVKASQDVTHVAVPCQWTTRATTINDLISVYSAGGSKRTLVFCATKKQCNELCVDEGITSECQALHGDITQASQWGWE
jgi:superfamily II DNA/RNA helicase